MWMACSDKPTESASHYLMYKILFILFLMIGLAESRLLLIYFSPLSVPNSLFFSFSFTLLTWTLHQNNKLTLLWFFTGYYWYYFFTCICDIASSSLFACFYFISDCDCACVFVVVVLLSYRFTMKQVVVVLVFPGEFPHCI